MPLHCDEIIRKALSRNMTDEQIDEFLSAAQAMFKKINRDDNPDLALELAEREIARKRLKAMAQARAQAIQQQRREANLQLVLKDWQGREWQGLEALMVGRQDNVNQSHFGVDQISKSLADQYLGALITGIRKLGPEHWALFRKGKLDREISRALWLVDKPDQYQGPDMAMQMARVIHQTGERARLDQNKQGAAILKLEGYIVRQSHNQDKILAAGPKAWKDFIASRLDWTRTADGDFDPEVDPKAADDFLQGLWEAFASGIHEKKPGGVNPNPLTSPSAVGTTAAKLNQNRVLHFKDGDAWFEYNEAFGHGTLREALQSGLRSAAGNAALMRQFGPSPLAGFQNLIRDVKQALKSKNDYEGIRRLEAKQKRLHNDWITIDGSTEVAGNPTLAAVGRNIRAWNNMTKLGGVLISSITDIPSFAYEFAYHGQGFLRSMADGLKSFVHGRGSQEQQEILASCGVFFDSMNAELCARFSGGNLEQKINYTGNLFFRVNGLSWWTDAWKKAAGLMQAHELASWAARDYAGLSHPARRLLKLYGIDEDGWNLLRHGKLRAADGKDYLTPEIAQDIKSQDLQALFAKRNKTWTTGQGEQYKDELEERLRCLIRDRVSYAVLEPDARTRAILYQGNATGTPAGEALRFVMQFKSFPTAFLQKTVGRETHGREAQGFGRSLLNNFIADQYGERSNFCRMFLMMSLFGYAAMTAKQLAAGKTPRDPKDPKTWLAAMTQGGGLGFYGDFLLGEKSRVGSSFLASLAGPTFTQAESVYNLYQNAKEGKDVASESFRLFFNAIPGNNLFYFRTAFDYLIGFNLYEMMNPGYISRMKQRVKRDTNQSFWLPLHKWR